MLERNLVDTGIVGAGVATRCNATVLVSASRSRGTDDRACSTFSRPIPRPVPPRPSLTTSTTCDGDVRRCHSHADPADAPRPCRRLQRLCPFSTTVYWLFGHPDDESLAAGGAIREAQWAGHRNVVVIFSSGENTAVRRQLGLIAGADDRVTRGRDRAGDGVHRRHRRALPRHSGRSNHRPDRAQRHRRDIGRGDGRPIWFRGHSPYDRYLGLACGHMDHCAIANALMAEWRAGNIEHLLFYRIGHLFGEARAGECRRAHP